ncbi:MAG: DUF4364 family protein [Acutalibacter sp.]|nr:DUF4364 family protein [Acutalibacter sp.]
MSQNAFTGGVDPGGLWTQNDVRILICYILASVNAPLSEEDIRGVIQGRALANYFETADALAALEALGHVVRDQEGFRVTETGRQVAEGLDTSLPLAVRDKALEAALSLLARGRAQRENTVEILEEGRGCRVVCRVSGGQDLELMALSLYVPDRAQARLVQESFYQNPDHIYKLLLAALTGDKSYTGE